MPTYDYECDACGHKFERFQSITARAIKRCPACGANRARRLIGTGAGIIFKGSGFYQTDYRSESYKKAAKADSESKPSEGKDKSAEKKDSSGKKASGKSDSGGSGGSKD